MQSRRSYPCDVSDEEWALVAPYLTLLPETAAQREHSLREVFNGLRYVVCYGVAWRAMPQSRPSDGSWTWVKKESRAQQTAIPA